MKFISGWVSVIDWVGGIRWGVGRGGEEGGAELWILLFNFVVADVCDDDVAEENVISAVWEDDVWSAQLTTDAVKWCQSVSDPLSSAIVIVIICVECLSWRWSRRLDQQRTSGLLFPSSSSIFDDVQSCKKHCFEELKVDLDSRYWCGLAMLDICTKYYVTEGLQLLCICCRGCVDVLQLW